MQPYCNIPYRNAKVNRNSCKKLRSCRSCWQAAQMYECIKLDVPLDTSHFWDGFCKPDKTTNSVKARVIPNVLFRPNRVFVFG